MKVTMYSPWPNKSFVSHALTYTAAAQSRDHKREKQYFARARSEGLRDLLPADRLYIMGHGVDSLDAIMADTDTPWKEDYRAQGYSSYTGKLEKYPTLTPDDLIKKLTDEGLPDTVTDIRLWVCKGGDFEFSRFGWEFTAKIRKINKSAIVTAYKGYMLLVGKTGRKRGQLDMKASASSPAKDLRTVISDSELFKQLEPLYLDD